METTNFQASDNYYSVTSSFLSGFTFGTLELNGTSMNAILVDFNNGSQYIYFGVSDAVVNTIKGVCIANQGEPGISVGSTFHKLLQHYPVYSRLHTSI